MNGRGILLLRMRKLINGSLILFDNYTRYILSLITQINLKQSEFVHPILFNMYKRVCYGFQVKLVKFFLICITRDIRTQVAFDSSQSAKGYLNQILK